MSNKILFVASTHKHFKGFHIPYIQMLQRWGYEVHLVGNDSEIEKIEANCQYNLPIKRNPFSFYNVEAIRQLIKLIQNEGYNLIHCHTAMGSVVGRLAALSFRNQGLKVLYTAHGFHFFKDSPLHYWWIYYPIEKLLSRFTDGLILINQEDFDLVNNCNFKQAKSYLIPGVGVKSDRFFPISKQLKLQYKKKNGLSAQDFVLVYTAEYIERKDHCFILDNVKRLKEKIPNVKILFAGRGKLFGSVKKRIEKESLQDTVKQLGFRKDIDQIYQMSDVGISSSVQEGLPMNIAEEMFTGLPIVATNIRGHWDLISHGENGFLYSKGDVESFVSYISKLYEDLEFYENMSETAIEKAKKFELSNAMKEMKRIYREHLDFQKG